MPEEIGIAGFNSSPEAAQWARTCLNVPRWADALVAGRPYPDRGALLAAVARVAQPFTAAEIDQALTRHPRIGDRPVGADAEARMSSSEQSAVARAGADALAQLHAGNVAYEERFHRVFLIRAAGRDGAEVLAALTERLDNDDAKELTVIERELREIAALRLAGLIGG